MNSRFTSGQRVAILRDATFEGPQIIEATFVRMLDRDTALVRLANVGEKAERVDSLTAMPERDG